MLVFHKVSQFNGHRCIFRHLSLTVDAPRVCITGPNGIGKTTLLLLAAGLISPREGEITYQKQNVLLTSSKKNIGISASKVALPAFMTVKELLKFHALQFNCPTNKWTSEFGLEPYLATKVSNLSLGNYKKLSLITALMHKPDLLLLDEPGNGLDEQTRAVLEKVLNSYPGQIIVASHETVFSDNTDVQHIALENIIDGAV
ncbi:UNVERIFIED_ORG: ABC-2 type transport system ATP-binding protein/heme exporter protein A [Idiomarina abyssalis]|uniref:ABC transporter ATP-binding protein n=1 Tax=Idiomarina sp. 017G TaxID=2183988 RepID=UPI000E0F0308|nr:ATP-binding cassette domain-containing protein [Idiomarina sp. 017G]TDO47445.1 ABC-2 type transport system ATP-binding protein/heme exporter protein A [Idiomarina sp. 017G]